MAYLKGRFQQDRIHLSLFTKRHIKVSLVVIAGGRWHLEFALIYQCKLASINQIDVGPSYSESVEFRSQCSCQFQIYLVDLIGENQNK